MEQNTSKGKVIFAGAGPGDPELITLKAMRCLKEAEVVITDRLVSEQILDEYVNKNAMLLHVGKQAGRAGSTPQTLINELLVDYALQGKRVVRLKGGDTTIFSNILDELQALTREGIPFEIIPGITAASGAGACAGIPLTARGYANAVRFLTFHKPDLLETTYWRELANTADTLVFYMSSGTLDTLVETLQFHGIASDRFLSVVEQATTPMQQVFCTNIYDYAKNGKGRSFLSPSLVIVGKVACLHQSFGWLPDGLSREPYFETVTDTKKTEARA